MKQNSGFTLIELLVAVAITALISVVIVQTFLVTLRSNAKAEANRSIRQSGDYAMNRIKKDIYEAVIPEANCPTLASTSLSFSKSTSVITVGKELNGSPSICRLYYDVDGVRSYLTPSDIEVTDCLSPLFSCTATAGYITSVKITFSLSTLGTASDLDRASIPYSSTVTARSNL